MGQSKNRPKDRWACNAKSLVWCLVRELDLLHPVLQPVSRQSLGILTNSTLLYEHSFIFLRLLNYWKQSFISGLRLTGSCFLGKISNPDQTNKENLSLIRPNKLHSYNFTQKSFIYRFRILPKYLNPIKITGTYSPAYVIFKRDICS